MDQSIFALQLIGLALATILNLTLGLFVFFRNPKDLIYKIFLALAVSLAIWCASIFFDLYFYNIPDLLNFFDRLPFISGLLIALFFYLFAFLYPYKSSSIFKSAILIYSGVILVFTYIIFSSLFFIENTQNFNLPLRAPNPATYIIYSVVLVTPFILGLWQLYRKMRDGDGVYRQGFPFFISIVAIVIALSFFFNLFLAGVNNNSFISVGPISSLLFIYAIMRMIISKE